MRELCRNSISSATGSAKRSMLYLQRTCLHGGTHWQLPVQLPSVSRFPAFDVATFAVDGGEQSAADQLKGCEVKAAESSTRHYLHLHGFTVAGRQPAVIQVDWDAVTVQLHSRSVWVCSAQAVHWDLLSLQWTLTNVAAASLSRHHKTLLT